MCLWFLSLLLCYGGCSSVCAHVVAVLSTCILLPLTCQVTSKMAAMNVNEEKGHGTIKAPASIDPEADAGVLRKAMKGIGNYVYILAVRTVFE